MFCKNAHTCPPKGNGVQAICCPLLYHRSSSMPLMCWTRTREMLLSKATSTSQAGDPRQLMPRAVVRGRRGRRGRSRLVKKRIFGGTELVDRLKSGLFGRRIGKRIFVDRCFLILVMVNWELISLMFGFLWFSVCCSLE